MCFAPQRRALFEDLNFQKCSEAGVLCTSWLGFVLRATTACTFWTSGVLCTFWLGHVLRATTACKCALRHNSVQFFISHLATWLRTRRFREPTEPQIIGKTQCSATFSTLSRTYIFLLTLSLLWSSLFFSSLTLPTSAFSSVHIVGSLTSKLPSIILTIFIYVYGLMEQWVWNSINSLHCNWIAITILEPYKNYIIYITSNLVSPHQAAARLSENLPGLRVVQQRGGTACELLRRLYDPWAQRWMEGRCPKVAVFPGKNEDFNHLLLKNLKGRARSA